jgi:hypothetical protein
MVSLIDQFCYPRLFSVPVYRSLCIKPAGDKIFPKLIEFIDKNGGGPACGCESGIKRKVEPKVGSAIALGCV